MDHFTYNNPLEDRLSSIEIPYVARIDYDSEGLEGFPVRSGFTNAEGQFDLETRSLEDCTSFIQSWLYFGVIGEFIQQPLQISKFIYPSAQNGGKDVLQWFPYGHELIDD